MRSAQRVDVERPDTGRRGRARVAGAAGRTGGALRGIACDGRHPAAVFFAAAARGLRGARAAWRSCSGCSSPTCSSTRAASAAPTRARSSRSCADRTAFLTDVSSVGSTVGGAPVLPILVGLIAIVCAIMRQWRIAAFAVFVLVVESATYRVTSLVVPRDRPHVARLEDLPADASYPSGHTAASIAVYCRPRAAAHVGVPEAQLARRGLGDRRSLLPVFVAVLAHVPRHAPSARRRRRAR